MRSLTLAIVGFAALTQAAPTPEEAKHLQDRQFGLGKPTATICIGSCRPTIPVLIPVKPARPTGGFHIGQDEQQQQQEIKRDSKDESVVSIKKTCSSLAETLSPDSANSAYNLLMEDCLLLFQKHKVDFKLLGIWSSFKISTHNIKRDPGQIIIGACSESDVKALVTQFQYMVAKYGRENVPYDVAVLMEAIKAALLYCALASPTTGPFIPPDVVIGNPIIVKPDPTTPGGPITPDPYESGGPIVPDKGSGGGPVVPSNKKRTVSSGGIVIGPYVPGGPLVPDTPIKGGVVKPSD